MRLATWNVLADAYLTPAWYREVEPALLEPARRLAKVLERAAGLEVDVLCLQEVDVQCARALTTHLAARGYTGRWRQKQRGRPDGCAMFWRGLVALEERVLVQPDGSGHVVQATDFQGLCVVTTHLKWSAAEGPQAERWTRKQAAALCDWVAGITAPLVVCGDLNVAPTDPVMARFAEAGLHDVFGGAERPHTCCAHGKSAKVDHVLARGLTARPSTLQFDQWGVRALPSEAEPSDHAPLLVEW